MSRRWLLSLALALALTGVSDANADPGFTFSFGGQFAMGGAWIDSSQVPDLHISRDPPRLGGFSGELGLSARLIYRELVSFDTAFLVDFSTGNATLRNPMTGPPRERQASLRTKELHVPLLVSVQAPLESDLFMNLRFYGGATFACSVAQQMNLTVTNDLTYWMPTAGFGTVLDIAGLMHVPVSLRYQINPDRSVRTAPIPGALNVDFEAAWQHRISLVIGISFPFNYCCHEP